MSHIAKIEIEIKDFEALKAACVRIGCELIEGQRSYTWYGQIVGDGPDLPEGFTESELGTCEHAIRVPGASYEVGVVTRRDGRPGYTLLWDYWSGGGLEKQLGPNGQRLIQAYGVDAAKRAARRAGYSVTEATNQDGSIVLNVQTGG